MQCARLTRQPFPPTDSLDVLDVLAMQDHLPGVQTAASVFSAITRAAEQQKHDLALQLTLSVTPTNQVAALVQELDPLGEQQLN